MKNYYRSAAVIKGFTLVELVVVMIVLGILALGLYIVWPDSSINLRAQAALLVNDIRYAQSLAMAQEQRYSWVKLTANSYQIKNASWTAVLLPSGENVMTFASGITFGTLTNLPNNMVVFNSQGAPYTDDARPDSVLSGTAVIPVISHGQIMNVSISPETGKVSL